VTTNEDIIAAFEQSWSQRSKQPPTLREFIGEHSPTEDCIVELVLIDLEFRWRQTRLSVPPSDALGGQPRLEDYQRQLDLREMPAFAIAEEYRSRTLWGDRPEHAHFVDRFPRAAAELLQLLPSVDSELRADRESTQHLPTFTLAAKQPDPRAPLPYSDFVLEQMLGQGGFGKVYRARQISLNRDVAVKALLKSRQFDSVAVDGFIQEAQILARLRHPAIVGVHGLGRFPGGGFFLVMDFIDGPNLSEQIVQSTLNLDEKLALIAAVAEAVHYSHTQGIVHCDLKPCNILLDKNGSPYVSDFGLAKLRSDERSVGGTPAFMAPEQLDPGIGETTALTDVFGIGRIMVTLLGDAGDRDLEAISDRCLAHNPSDRFPTAAAVAESIRLHE